MIETVFDIMVGGFAAIGILVVTALIANILDERHKEWKKNRHYAFKIYDRVITKYDDEIIICTVIDRKITDTGHRLYRLTPCIDLYNVDFINDVSREWIRGSDITYPKWR